MGGLHGPAHQAPQGLDAGGQQVLQKGADEEEGQEEHQSHDGHEHGDGGVFTGEDAVQLLAALVLPALVGLDDAAAAHPLNEGKAHIRHGGAPIQAPLLFHLQNDMRQHLRLVVIQSKLGGDALVALDELTCREAEGNVGALSVILDQVAHGVEGPVDGAAVVGGVAEVLAQGALLILGDVDGVAHQLVHALVAGGGDGHHRHPQQGLHGVHVHGAAVAGELVHHVQGHHHGHIHLQQLHGEVEVALDIGGVHDIDDGPGLLLQHEVAAHQLLAGIGGHGVDARQVGDGGVSMAPDDAVLTVHGDAGEVAHVLVGAGELVEESGLAAVLVAHQGEGEHGALGQRRARALGVELALLAQTGVMALPALPPVLFFLGRRGQGLHGDLLRVGQPEGQLIAVEPQLHGVAHGGQLHHGYLRPGDDAHIQKMLPQSALTPHGQYPPALAGL